MLLEKEVDSQVDFLEFDKEALSQKTLQEPPTLTKEFLEKDNSVQELRFILNSVGIVLDLPMTYLIKKICYSYILRGANVSIKELIDLKNNVLNLNQKEDGKGM